MRTGRGHPPLLEHPRRGKGVNPYPLPGKWRGDGVYVRVRSPRTGMAFGEPREFTLRGARKGVRHVYTIKSWCHALYIF